MYNGKQYDHLFYAGQKLMLENYLPKYFSFTNSGNQNAKEYSLNLYDGKPVFIKSDKNILGVDSAYVEFGNFHRVMINQIVSYNDEDYALVRCISHAADYAGGDIYTEITWIKMSDFGGAVLIEN
ncbi:hypothetical protein PT287_09075 [Lactobacillus sp. ESL0679]|uniref:hypothetical protein n=1 Tax=Lactobacillus sp. ESL0679 TaxID=2983209 RepID=UPI0023F6E05F|nr:hypothetical protein [Lactobacillus sp. ESL0679]MDF7683647.1 hypothetical protein [Lactobacillus sp. ESL0679]